MVRALYASFSGTLYAVMRASDNQTAEIPVLAAGGVSHAAAQDAFCQGTDCVVTQLYDQSPNQNHLPIFNYPKRHPTDEHNRTNRGVNASADPHTLNGHKVYSAYMPTGGYGYRTPPGAAKGVATGSEPESMYAIFSGKNFNNRCCYDYGASLRVMHVVCLPACLHLLTHAVLPYTP
eukprot:COSAG01_NODE_12628_length_1709_cov_1.169565_2_plen_177_part_00